MWLHLPPEPEPKPEPHLALVSWHISPPFCCVTLHAFCVLFAVHKLAVDDPNISLRPENGEPTASSSKSWEWIPGVEWRGYRSDSRFILTLRLFGLTDWPAGQTSKNWRTGEPKNPRTPEDSPSLPALLLVMMLPQFRTVRMSLAINTILFATGTLKKVASLKITNRSQYLKTGF